MAREGRGATWPDWGEPSRDHIIDGARDGHRNADTARSALARASEIIQQVRTGVSGIGVPQLRAQLGVAHAQLQAALEALEQAIDAAQQAHICAGTIELALRDIERQQPPEARWPRFGRKIHGALLVDAVHAMSEGRQVAIELDAALGDLSRLMSDLNPPRRPLPMLHATIPGRLAALASRLVNTARGLGRAQIHFLTIANQLLNTRQSAPED